MNSEQRQIRRQARERELRRRRRLTVLAAILLAAGAIVTIVLANGGGATDSASHRQALTRRVSPHRARRGTRPSSAGQVSHKPGTSPVAILMYHVINPAPAGAPFPGLYVTPAEFATQMQALAQAGYHAVTMDQMLAYWRAGTPLPAGKPIVLSFDNGYQSQYTEALPVLRNLGWVGVENIQLTGLPPSQGGLSQTQIRGLLAAGWELDTQGYSHADLIALNSTQLRYQVANTRSVLQRRYHVAVNWFCYPSGHYNATVIQAVKEAGYVGSTTVIPGWASPGEDPFRLPRLRVLGGTGPQVLLNEIDSIRTDGPPPPSYPSG
jgi:peptidoglycan/xylan/chitin deacetylase (PgdA/CDA1 family)